MGSEDDEIYEDESDDWEFEEGLPQMDDQFIQRYLQGREALIGQEQKQRSGTSGRGRGL